MLRNLSFGLLVLLLLTSCLPASTLNLKLKMGNEAIEDVASSAEVKKKTVVYFVIDCSGSMGSNPYVGPIPGMDGKTRQEVLHICIEERWKSLPIGAEVHQYLYSGTLPPPFYKAGTNVIGSEKEKASFWFRGDE